MVTKQRRNKNEDDSVSHSSENFEIDWDSSKNSQSSSKSNSKRKTHLRHFPHVEQEQVLKRYSCALASDFLRQGNLYLTNNYFAFYSNIFGYVTKLLIPIQSVEEITKEKTAKIIPNAIGIRIGKQKHVFSSFIQRENSYAYIKKIWQSVNNDTGHMSDFDTDSLYSSEEEIQVDNNNDLHRSDNTDTFSSNIKTTTTGTTKTLSKFVWYSTIVSIIFLFFISGILLYKILKIQSNTVSISTPRGNFEKNLFSDNPEFLEKSYVSINEFLDKNSNVLSGVRKTLESLYKVLETENYDVKISQTG